MGQESTCSKTPSTLFDGDLQIFSNRKFHISEIEDIKIKIRMIDYDSFKISICIVLLNDKDIRIALENGQYRTINHREKKFDELKKEFLKFTTTIKRFKKKFLFYPVDDPHRLVSDLNMKFKCLVDNIMTQVRCNNSPIEFIQHDFITTFLVLPIVFGEKRNFKDSKSFSYLNPMPIQSFLAEFEPVDTIEIKCKLIDLVGFDVLLNEYTSKELTRKSRLVKFNMDLNKRRFYIHDIVSYHLEGNGDKNIVNKKVTICSGFIPNFTLSYVRQKNFGLFSMIKYDENDEEAISQLISLSVENGNSRTALMNKYLKNCGCNVKVIKLKESEKNSVTKSKRTSFCSKELYEENFCKKKGLKLLNNPFKTHEKEKKDIYDFKEFTNAFMSMEEFIALLSKVLHTRTNVKLDCNKKAMDLFAEISNKKGIINVIDITKFRRNELIGYFKDKEVRITVDEFISTLETFVSNLKYQQKQMSSWTCKEVKNFLSIIYYDIFNNVSFYDKFLSSSSNETFSICVFKNDNKEKIEYFDLMGTLVSIKSSDFIGDIEKSVLVRVLEEAWEVSYEVDFMKYLCLHSCREKLLCTPVFEFISFLHKMRKNLMDQAMDIKWINYYLYIEKKLEEKINEYWEEDQTHANALIKIVRAIQAELTGWGKRILRANEITLKKIVHHAKLAVVQAFDDGILNWNIGYPESALNFFVNEFDYPSVFRGLKKGEIDLQYYKMRAKVNFSSNEVNFINKLSYKFLNGVMNQKTHPFGLLHVGLILSGIQFDWFNNGIIDVRVGKCSSKHSYLCTDIGEFHVKNAELEKFIHRMCMFLFCFNMTKKYRPYRDLPMFSLKKKNYTNASCHDFIVDLVTEVFTEENGFISDRLNERGFIFHKDIFNVLQKAMGNRDRKKHYKFFKYDDDKIFQKKFGLYDINVEEFINKDLPNGKGMIIFWNIVQFNKFIKRFFPTSELFTILMEDYSGKFNVLKSFDRSFHMKMNASKSSNIARVFSCTFCRLLGKMKSLKELEF